MLGLYVDACHLEQVSDCTCLKAHCAAAHTQCYYVPISVGHGFNCTPSSVRHIFAYLLEGPENNPPLLGMKLLQRLSSLNSMCGYSCIGEVKGGGTNNEDSCKQVYAHDRARVFT